MQPISYKSQIITRRNKTAAAALLLVAALATAAHAAPVNVNTASAAEIAAALNGIGEAKAAAIVDHRRRNGPFRSADALTAIPGIGAKILERIRADVMLESASASVATNTTK